MAFTDDSEIASPVGTVLMHELTRNSILLAVHTMVFSLEEMYDA